jgi:hypothetical protein
VTAIFSVTELATLSFSFLATDSATPSPSFSLMASVFSWQLFSFSSATLWASALVIWPGSVKLSRRFEEFPQTKPADRRALH